MIDQFGLDPTDPLAPLIKDMRAKLNHMVEREIRVEAIFIDLADRIRGVHVVTPAALAELHRAAAMGAERAARDMARVHARRTLPLLVAALALTAALAAAMGFYAGQAIAWAGVHETEVRLMQAFTDGPAAAAAWLGLMRTNDPVAALAACRPFVDTTGRRACYLPVALEPAHRGPAMQAAR